MMIVVKCGIVALNLVTHLILIYSGWESLGSGSYEYTVGVSK